MEITKEPSLTELNCSDTAGADPGIFGRGGGGGPNSTRYVETVLQLITSIPHQFSIFVHHIP